MCKNRSDNVWILKKNTHTQKKWGGGRRKIEKRSGERKGKHKIYHTTV